MTRNSGRRQVTLRASAPQQEQAKQAGPGFIRLPPEVVAAGGLLMSDQPAEGHAQLGGLLRDGFMPVNLEQSGLRLLNIDPPVFTVPEFLTPQECDNLINAVLDAESTAPGSMAQSAVGNAAGGAAGGGSIRTSSTLGFTSAKLRDFPGLKAPLETLLTKAQVSLSLHHGIGAQNDTIQY